MILIYLKIRITTHDTDSVALFLKKYSSSHMICWEHIATNNQHCHIYLETTSQKQSIVQWIRRRIGKGNQIYSCVLLKDRHPIEYLAYITKTGQFDTFQLEKPVIDKATEYNKKVVADMKKKKKDKSSITSFKTILKAWGEAQRPCYTTDQEKHRDFPRKVAMFVVNYYREHNLFIREFHLTSLVQTLLLHLDPSYNYALTDSILRRLNEI